MEVFIEDNRGRRQTLENVWNALPASSLHFSHYIILKTWSIPVELHEPLIMPRQPNLLQADVKIVVGGITLASYLFSPLYLQIESDRTGYDYLNCVGVFLTSPGDWLSAPLLILHNEGTHWERIGAFHMTHMLLSQAHPLAPNNDDLMTWEAKFQAWTSKIPISFGEFRIG